MDHGKGAGTTEPAPVGPAGDAGPMRPGGTKPYTQLLHSESDLKTERARPREQGSSTLGFLVVTVLMTLPAVVLTRVGLT